MLKVYTDAAFAYKINRPAQLFDSTPDHFL